MMTMSIIDDLRDALGKAREEHRRDRDDLNAVDEVVRCALWTGDVNDALQERWGAAATNEECSESSMRTAEEAVEAALRQWWRQDCQEIPDD